MAESNEQNQTGVMAWLESLVNMCSLVLGILIAYMTITNSSRIEALTHNMETSNLVSDLIDNISEKDIEQDIALLALEHTLTSNSHNDLKDKNEKLLARIAASAYDPQEQLEDGSNSNSLAKGQYSTDILERIIENSYQGYPDTTTIKNIVYDHEAMETAAWIAAKALYYGALDFKDNVRSPSTILNATFSKADDDIKNTENDTIKLEEAGYKINNDSDSELERNPKQANVVRSNLIANTVQTVSDESKTIYIHYDNPDSINRVKKLSEALKEEGWYVTPNLQLIGVDKPNCATTTSVRYFHEVDKNNAKELKESIERKSNNMGLEINNQQFRLHNLVGWRYSRNVPTGQLELWIAEKSQDCIKNKEKQNTANKN